MYVIGQAPRDRALALPLLMTEAELSLAMATRSELSIRAAVMNCVARCADSEAPLCSLGEFLEQLAAMGWSQEDVLTVRTTALRLLEKSSGPGAVTQPTTFWPPVSPPLPPLAS